MSVALLTKGMIAPAIYTLFLSDSIQASLDGTDVSCENEQSPVIKIGNSVILDFLVSASGVRLTAMQLQAADDILFAVKEDAQDANNDSLIFKDIADGVEILPDMGDTSPNVRVTLSPSDTLLEAGAYPSALKINFSADNVKEAILQFNGACFDEIYFAQDVIR